MNKRFKVLLLLEIPGEHKRSAIATVKAADGEVMLGKVPAIVDSLERLFVAAIQTGATATLTLSMRPMADDEPD